LKVKIRHSSAMLEALLAGNIVWRRDPDFGYDIVDVEHPANAALVELVPAEILEPRRFFDREGRIDEYCAWVPNINSQRRAVLERFAVDSKFIEATCPA